jgi:hypothetical protein
LPRNRDLGALSFFSFICRLFKTTLLAPASSGAAGSSTPTRRIFSSLLRARRERPRGCRAAERG